MAFLFFFKFLSDFLPFYLFFISVFPSIFLNLISFSILFGLLLRSFFKFFSRFFFNVSPPQFLVFVGLLFMRIAYLVHVYRGTRVPRSTKWCCTSSFCAHQNSTQAPRATTCHPASTASTAQRYQPCTRQQSTYYVPIKARQRGGSKPTRVAENQHVSMYVLLHFCCVCHPAVCSMSFNVITHF